jgi:hypothetical protein
MKIFKSKMGAYIVLTLSIPLLAQDRVMKDPQPAATVLGFDMSVGYVNLTNVSQHVNLNGVQGDGSVDLNLHWSVLADLMYVRKPDVFDTGRPEFVLALLVGPTFYPFELGKTRMLIHALCGPGLVDGLGPMRAAALDGPAPGSQAGYFHGWMVRPSYGAGGGIEHALSARFAVRFEADYLRTAFFSPSGAVQPQSNLRLAAGVVFGSKWRQRFQ